MNLRCEECSRTTEFARGWRAKIVEDEEDPEMDAYVVCYCPACAQREFGESKPRAQGTRSLFPQTSFSRPSSLGCSAVRARKPFLAGPPQSNSLSRPASE